MTETTQEERLYWNTQLHRRGRGNLSGPDLQRLLNDADRLAKYERDLFDERAGENRSQDTEWLRRGFLQRGAEIERLEDGIRALADRKERHAQALREEGDGDHCDGFAEALEDEVFDLRTLIQE